MPTLKQLACSIELGGTNTKLTEYGTHYGDGNVETFVAVPREEVPFSIHLESEGYIAPGLAMFVYMDGKYQCNRNRRGLVVPGAGVSPEKYQVDLRVRQKEAKQPDGSFLGRDWTFYGLNLVSSDNDADTSEEFLENMGTIEVIVLRCKDAPVIQPAVRQPIAPSHHSAVVSLPKPKVSKEPSSRHSAKPQTKAPSTKPSKAAISKPPSKTSKSEKASALSNFGIGVMMGGGMDGAGDDFERPSYRGRNQHIYDDPRAYGSPPVRRSRNVPDVFPSSLGATYSEYEYDGSRHKHNGRQYIPEHHADPSAYHYNSRPLAPHDPRPSTLHAPDSDVGQRSYYDAYRPSSQCPESLEPKRRRRTREPYFDPPKETRQEQPRGYRGYGYAGRLPVVNSNTEDDQSMIDRVRDYVPVPQIPRSYLPQSNEAVRDESVASSWADYHWQRPEMERYGQRVAPTTVSSNWRTKVWAKSLPKPGSTASSQWSDSRPWPTLKSTASSTRPKWSPQPSVHSSSRSKKSKDKTPGNESKAQDTSWDKVSAANWDEAPATNWDAIPVSNPDATPADDWNATPAAGPVIDDQPTTWDETNKPGPEKQPETNDWNTPEPQPATSGEKQPETNDWKEPDVTPSGDNNEVTQTSDWVEPTQETADTAQQAEIHESQGWGDTPAEEGVAPTGDWNETLAEENIAPTGDWNDASAEPVALPETKAPEKEAKPSQTKVPEKAKPTTNSQKPETKPQHHSTKEHNHQSHINPPSTRSQVRPQTSTDGAHTPPKPKPYWQDWNKKPADQAYEFSASRFRYLAPEETLPKVPAEAAKKHNIEHQVKTGKGAQYIHLCSRPEYLDEMKKPYAVFTFKYRSRKIIEETFGVKIKEDGQDLKAKLADMSKDQLAEELFRLKMAGKSGKSIQSPTVVSKVDAWMEKAASGKAPSVSHRSQAQSVHLKQVSQAGSRVQGSIKAASQAQGSNNDGGDWADPNDVSGGDKVEATGDWDAGQPIAGNDDTAAAW